MGRKEVSNFDEGERYANVSRDLRRLSRRPVVPSSRRTWAKLDAFPDLYWVTLCTVCLVHFFALQYVLLSLGTFTIYRHLHHTGHIQQRRQIQAGKVKQARQHKGIVSA